VRHCQQSKGTDHEKTCDDHDSTFFPVNQPEISLAKPPYGTPETTSQLTSDAVSVSLPPEQ
jgi:hypothetical protein